MKKIQLTPFWLHELKVFLAFLALILVIEFIPEMFSFSGMSTMYNAYYANRVWFEFWFALAAIYWGRVLYLLIINKIQKRQ